ncbi:MAG: hypothetical protein OXP08_03215 [bacterium]|nr:hypothetical protein [bacterium]
MTDTGPWALSRAEDQTDTPPDTDVVILIPASGPPTTRSIGHLRDDLATEVDRVPVWTAGDAVLVGTLRLRDSALWAATVAHTTTDARAPGRTQDWIVLGEVHTWSGATYYRAGRIIRDGHSLYLVLRNHLSTVDALPAGNTTDYVSLTDTRPIRVWNNTRTFETGEQVFHAADIWEALRTNTNVEPSDTTTATWARRLAGHRQAEAATITINENTQRHVNELTVGATTIDLPDLRRSQSGAVIVIHMGADSLALPNAAIDQDGRGYPGMISATMVERLFSLPNGTAAAWPTPPAYDSIPGRPSRWNWRGAWDVATAYEVGDVVFFEETVLNTWGEGLFLCLEAQAANGGSEPVYLLPTDHWLPLIGVHDYAPNQLPDALGNLVGDERLSYDVLKDAPAKDAPWPTAPASYPYSRLTGRPSIPSVPDTAAPWPTAPTWDDVRNRPTIPAQPRGPIGGWQAGYAYRVGDIARRRVSDGRYEVFAWCIQAHTSDLDNVIPDNLSDNAWWRVAGWVEQSDWNAAETDTSYIRNKPADTQLAHSLDVPLWGAAYNADGSPLWRRLHQPGQGSSGTRLTTQAFAAGTLVAFRARPEGGQNTHGELLTWTVWETTTTEIGTSTDGLVATGGLPIPVTYWVTGAPLPAPETLIARLSKDASGNILIAQPAGSGTWTSLHLHSLNIERQVYAPT